MPKTEKKAKAPKAPEAKKPDASDLPNCELLESVTALVLKKVVYQTANAIAVRDRDARKRIHWIPRKRVLKIERGKKLIGWERFWFTRGSPADSASGCLLCGHAGIEEAQPTQSYWH